MRFALTVLSCVLAVATGAPAGTTGIAITGLAFGPATITIKAGDTVEWTNNDFVDHTATDAHGAWDIDLPAGKSGSFTFETPGTFPYICKVHPNMTGTIDVQPQ